MSTHGRAPIAAAAEEDPLPGGLIVAHFRIDPGQRVLRALAGGGLVILLGSIFIAGALLRSRVTSDRPMHSRAMRVPARDAIYRGVPVDVDGNPIDQGDSVLWELGLGALGLSSILLGGSVVIVGLRRELRTERYLALRTDGALYRDGDRASGVYWEDIEAVRWDAGTREVRFVFHDGEAWTRGERYAGIEGPELAKRAAEIRRKALFGLYG